MPPMSSPARRVLGEKDANASLNITSPRKSLKTSIDARPTASVKTQSKALTGALNSISASPRIGQKRRIAEVEGVETRDWEDTMKASQTTDIVSDSASETDHMETSMLSVVSAADTTMTSFGIVASQENAAHQEFELIESEMSQRTIDKIHAVTLPQNTSQPSQFRDRPNLTHDASLDSVGMSNFLNFHSDASSQESDGLRMIDSSKVEKEVQEEHVDAEQPAQKELSEEAQRKAMMEEKAAQLRTRLQLAFFKVETRQTNTPFSRLKVPQSHRRKSSSPPSLPPPPMLLPPQHSYSRSFSTKPNQGLGLSPEMRIASMRAQAAMQLKPPVPSLNSLPIPQIVPTAFSARWAEEAPSSETHGHPQNQNLPQVDGNNDQSPDLPSSPPISNRSLHIHEDDTATAARYRIGSSASTDIEVINVLPSPKSPAQASNRTERLSPTPPNEENKTADVETNTEKLSASGSDKDAEHNEQGPRGNVVQDEAVSGLLQLMKSGSTKTGNIKGPMCGL